jgi:hypothetical protein
MEKLVMNPDAGIEVRRKTIEILIDSNSQNLKSISEKLLKDEDLKIWAARGLSKFEDNRTGQMLVFSLQAFDGEERDELVEILCGRVNWADALLTGIENGQVSKSLISPYHALQIKSLKNENLDKRLDQCWGVIRTSPEIFV